MLRPETSDFLRIPYALMIHCSLRTSRMEINASSLPHFPLLSLGNMTPYFLFFSNPWIFLPEIPPVQLTFLGIKITWILVHGSSGHHSFYCEEVRKFLLFSWLVPMNCAHICRSEVSMRKVVTVMLNNSLSRTYTCFKLKQTHQVLSWSASGYFKTWI